MAVEMDAARFEELVARAIEQIPARLLPDRILIFRGPLLRYCLDEAEVVEEVRITVWHEVAHFFGIGDHELDELGYA